MLVLLIIEIVVVAAMAAFFVFMGLSLFFYGAPFLPSYRQSKRAILKPLFEIAKSAPGRRFVDLGSGDGRVVAEFAKQGFEAAGVELNPFLVWWSRMVLKKSNLKNARILRGDIFKTDLNDFDVVYLFQFTTTNALLENKLKKELKPGAIVISAQFPFHNLNLLKKEGVFWVYKI